MSAPSPTSVYPPVSALLMIFVLGCVGLSADGDIAVRPFDDSFNSDWLYQRGPSDTAAFPETPDFDWLPVTLPHVRPAYPSTPGSLRPSDRGGYSAWYRRHITMSKIPAEKLIFLTLCGEVSKMRVWINGHKFDPIPTDRSRIEYDITHRFRVGRGRDNVIAIEHQSSRSRQAVFPGSSESAGVSLSVRSRVHLVAEKFELLGPTRETKGSQLRLRTAVANYRESEVEVVVRNQVFNPAGDIVANSEVVVLVQPGDLVPITDDIVLTPEKPIPPTLARDYRIKTTLFENSTQLDQIESIRDDAGFTEIRHLDQGNFLTAN